MKKLLTFAFLICVTFTLSCNVTDIDLLPDDVPEMETKPELPTEVVTRSEEGTVIPSGSSQGADYLSQVLNMSFLIYLNPGMMQGDQKNKNYLAVSDKGSIEMSTKSQTGMYPRWIYESKPASGSQLARYGIVHEKTGKLLHYELIKDEFVPAFIDGTILSFMSTLQPRNSPKEDGFIITTWPSVWGKIYDQRFLAPKSLYDNTLILHDKMLANASTSWNIVPDEEFEILDIAFDFIPGEDSYAIEDLRMNHAYFENPDIFGNMEFGFSYTAEESQTSTFSQTEAHKKSMSISQSTTTNFKTKIPFISTGISFSINTAITEEWSEQFTMGETTQKKEVETFSYKYSIPPGLSGTFAIQKIRQTVNLTYVATLRGKTSRTIMKSKGKWNGVKMTTLKVQPVDIQGRDLPLSLFMEENPDGPEIGTKEYTIELPGITFTDQQSDFSGYIHSLAIAGENNMSTNEALVDAVNTQFKSAGITFMKAYRYVNENGFKKLLIQFENNETNDNRKITFIGDENTRYIATQYCLGEIYEIAGWQSSPIRYKEGDKCNIILSGSTKGLTYHLHRNGIEIESKEGTGSALLFSDFYDQGTYTIITNTGAVMKGYHVVRFL